MLPSPRRGCFTLRRARSHHCRSHRNMTQMYMHFFHVIQAGFSPRAHLIAAWDARPEEEVIVDRLYCKRTGSLVPYTFKEYSPKLKEVLSIKVCVASCLCVTLPLRTHVEYLEEKNSFAYDASPFLCLLLVFVSFGVVLCALMKGWASLTDLKNGRELSQRSACLYSIPISITPSAVIVLKEFRSDLSLSAFAISTQLVERQNSTQLVERQNSLQKEEKATLFRSIPGVFFKPLTTHSSAWPINLFSFAPILVFSSLSTRLFVLNGSCGR